MHCFFLVRNCGGVIHLLNPILLSKSSRHEEGTISYLSLCVGIRGDGLFITILVRLSVVEDIYVCSRSENFS
jgi:hypothetical protein